MTPEVRPPNRSKENWNLKYRPRTVSTKVEVKMAKHRKFW